MQHIPRTSFSSRLKAKPLLIFSKKIYLEVQLPGITRWRERPDLAVNNFSLNHTGAWLAAESMLQVMVLDAECVCVCVRETGVQGLGTFAHLLPLLPALKFCI